MGDGVVVLHVDDNAALRDLTAELLEKVEPSITVRSEADPSRVLDLLDSATIDCVVSDYEMPYLDGIELCTAIRSTKPDFPFFLFTGKARASVIESALEAGVTDFVEKDAGVEQYRLLANRIMNAVRHHRDRDRLAEFERLISSMPRSSSSRGWTTEETD